MRERFAALKDKRVLVIHGVLSDVLTQDGIETMRAIKPDLQVVEVPGVGHPPTLDEPEARAALWGFLSSVP